MNIKIYKNLLLISALCLVSYNSYGQGNISMVDEAADGPTVVYGSAQESGGGRDSFTIEQPDGAPNPLGDPIVVPEQSEQSEENQNPLLQDSPKQNGSGANASSGSNNQLQQVNPNTPQGQEQLGNDFQNTLMEANGMIYDVQAYPEEDLNAIGNPSNPATLYSPNVNP